VRGIVFNTAKVIKILANENKGETYLVETISNFDNYQTVADHMDGAYGFLKPGTLARISGDDISSVGPAPSKKIKSQVELKYCSKARIAEQAFEMVQENTNGETSTNDSTVLLRHVVTNITIGSKSNHNILKVAGTADEKKLNFSLTLENVFADDDHKFEGSDNFYRIHAAASTKVLSSGAFGKALYDKPEWKMLYTPDIKKTESTDLWTLRPVELKLGVIEGGVLEEDDDDEHAAWLESKAYHGGLNGSGTDRLSKLAPWRLLGVERGSTEKEVKARFRKLSRRFHPDKTRHGMSKAEAEVRGDLFVLLQRAYDGLKDSDSDKKDAFKIDAEVEETLFGESEYVVELMPDMFKRFVGKNGVEGQFILDKTYTNFENRTEDETEDSNDCPTNGNNETCSDDLDDKILNTENEAQVWLLFLYSARCGMSRTAAPYIELAAAHLLKLTNIRVAAFGCGIHGESLERSKQIGHRAAIEDPICGDFGRRETPSSHVVVQVLKGDDKFRQQAALFRSFYSAAAVGGVYELWPSNLVNFAETASIDWSNTKLVEQFTRSDFEDENSTFTSTFRIVAFLDASQNIDPLDDKNNALKSIQNALLVALPRLAAQVVQAGGRVGTAICALDDESDGDAVDCESIGVAWLPDVKIFGVNQTTGISLLNDEIAEERDIQIALEALVNTITSLFGLDPTDIRKDDEPEINEEPPSQCGPEMNMEFDLNEFDELDAPEKIPLLDDSPFQEIENDASEEIEYDTPEEIEYDTPEEIASAPPKPKLAPRSKTNNISPRAHRESSRRVHSGGGTLYGGISGSSTAGAIGS